MPTCRSCRALPAAIPCQCCGRPVSGLASHVQAPSHAGAQWPCLFVSAYRIGTRRGALAYRCGGSVGLVGASMAPHAPTSRFIPGARAAGGHLRQMERAKR
jgi:hypothetical protein